jgi:hypothetical protein
MPILSSRIHRIGFLIGVATAMLSMGCARTTVEQSLAAAVKAGDVNAELDFWDAIAERPVVCNDEGFHGLLLFSDGEDSSTSYEQRLAAARERGWVTESWSEPANLAMQRGVLARAIVLHCKIKGGVMIQMLGPVQRYCTRELQYMGMMGFGSEQQAVSGREYMGVLSKAQDYLVLQEEIATLEAERNAAPAPVTPPPPAPEPAPPKVEERIPTSDLPGKRRFTP